MNLPTHYLRTAKFYLQGMWKAAQLSTDIVENARGKILLLYHGIDYSNDTSVNTKFTGLKNFEEQVKLLKQNTNVISITDYVEDRLNPDKLNVTITFDDGFLNNYTLAQPVLEKHAIPATFFITPVWHQQKNILWPDLVDHATSHAPSSISIGGEQFKKGINGRFYHSSGEPIHRFVIKQNHPFIEKLYSRMLPYAKFMDNEAMDIYWQLMGPTEIKELSVNPLFTIGAHGYTHTCLTNVHDEEVVSELTIPKKVLEDVTGKPVDFFAYPFSIHNSHTIQLAKNMGYKFQFSGSEVNRAEDVLTRFTTNPYLSPANQLLFTANKKY